MVLLIIVCMYMYVVITTLLVLPGGLGRSFHPYLYRANNFAPYYITYSVGTAINQKDKDPLGSFHWPCGIDKGLGHIGYYYYHLFVLKKS